LALVIRRYLTNGGLDTAFGSGGESRNDVNFAPNRMAARALGSGFVVAVAPSRRRIMIVSVGTSGDISTIGDAEFFPSDDDATATAVAFDVDQQVVAPRGAAVAGIGPAPVALGVKLVAAGETRQSGRDGYGVSRFQLEGSPDRSFSKDGRTRTGFDDAAGGASVVAVDGRHRVVAAGQVRLLNPPDFGVVRAFRYLASGVVERLTGDRHLDDSDDSVTSITVSRGGDDVFVGGAVNVRGRRRLCVTMFGAGFGDFGAGLAGLQGVAVADVTSGPATDVRLDGQGRILAVGPAGGSIGVFRFLRNGRLDASFGVRGHVAIPYDVGSATPSAVVTDSQERIIVVGSAGREFAMARMSVTGRLDTTFGIGGKLFSSNSGLETLSAERVVIQPDGKIMVAGMGFFPA
jgi:uncharacterized delta-60 repeat protein